MRLAVLDIAGTTVHEGNVVYDVLRSVVEAEGAQVSPEDFHQWTGTEKRWAIENLLRIGGVEADDARIDAAHARFVTQLDEAYRATPPVEVPGAGEAIAALRARGIKVALTTGFARRTTDPILEGLGWTVGDGDADATLDAVVCAPDVRAGRPAPYMIHRVMELTGVDDVREVCAAGDTPADIRAARNAGVLAIGVLTGASTAADFEGADLDLVVGSITDLVNDPRFAGQA